MWLEPEGLGTDVVYPNGISNSLEPGDQLRLLGTIPGAHYRGLHCSSIVMAAALCTTAPPWQCRPRWPWRQLRLPGS